MNDDATNIWDEVPDWGGVGARRLVRPESERLGISLWEVHPGSRQFVSHYHVGSDELLIVLRGAPTVEMPSGERTLAEGDVLPFPRGPAGEHRLRNDGDVTARVLIVAAQSDPDVAIYPSSGKVATIVAGEHTYFRAADAIEHGGDE